MREEVEDGRFVRKKKSMERETDDDWLGHLGYLDFGQI